MALNINTNITNNLDGYLLDAKNVKGTYVVVADREALSDLPETTRVVGTLAYVQDISGGDSDNHFFMYTGTGGYYGWTDLALENKYAILNTNENFAIQTYTFDSNINFYNVLEYQTIVVIFYDTTQPFLAFSTSGITLPNSGNPTVQLSNTITYNGTQYLVTLELRGGTTTQNATLSFQEIEGGSGGGSSTVQLKSYLSLFSMAFDVTTQAQQDNQNITDATRTFDFIFNVLPKQAESTMQFLSQQTGTTITTWSDALNAIKGIVENGANTYVRIGTLCFLLDALKTQGIDLTLKDSYYDNTMAEPAERIVPFKIIYGANDLSSIQFLDSLSNNEGRWKQLGYDFSLMDTTITTNYTETVYDEFTVSGGSSTGGGSGKLYDIKFNLSMYDNSGNDKDFAFQNGGDTSYQVNYGSTLPIELLIYESNFERLKQAFNQNTYLNVNITDINSLVSTINGIDESSYSPSNTSFLLLYALISYCDKAYICPSEIGGQALPSTPKIPIFCDDFNIMLGALDICYETSTNVLSCKIVDHDSSETVDLNYFSVNNSCTLTEYGTSGGGASATKTIYEYTVGQHIDYTINENGFDYDIDVSPEYKVFIDGDETEIVKNINYVILYINEQLSAIPGFTPFADITNFADYPSKATEIQTYLRTLYTQSILNDSGYSTMMFFVCEAPLVYIDETLLPNANDQSVLMQIMVKSFDNLYNNKYKIKSGLKVGGFDANSYMSTIADSGLVYEGTIFGPSVVFNKDAGNTLGQVFQSEALPTAFTPATERVFSIVCRGDAPTLTFSYNEATETISGGSSSSQPTIPERFSLAYNLVVNINQEQFANGSWTGSNSDNIRTFQYNGSNADETKSKELVEFLTGVNVLDSYNATKPTPCFVFCTQSNICWKLQWDNSLLHAYKVENFPFVVKQKYYNIVLNDVDDNSLPVSLQLNIPYDKMQDVYDSINQVLGGNISTPQEVIAVYDSLKADNISAQSYNLLCQLFIGLASVNMLSNLNNLFSDSDGFTKIIGIGLANISAGAGVFILSQTLNSNKISFTSGSTLSIFERDNPNELD